MRTHGRFEWIRLPEFCLLLILVVSTEMLSAQKNGPFSPRELKKLSVEELMNIEVTSVSKSPEKLTEVASAIQVITNEDIRRSTVTRLPEALSLAPNLQVAQSNSHDWGITARGFNGAPFANNTLADKLLVLIDGRSVYTPLFGGVFWDAQNVLLEDVDRIEVVSGPGGTLWGANAVNGVINIISKNARETQGWYASAAGGSFLRDYAGVRYGGHVDTNFFFRVYGQRFDQNSTTWIDSTESHDAWHMTQGGFRMDYVPGNSNTFSFQGDFYGGMADTGNTIINGQDVLGKWTHRFSENANLSLQVYFDRTWRDLTASDFSEQLSTYDIDLQHHFPIGSNNQVLWGAGYRMMNDEVENSISLTFTPAERRLQLFNG
ncbi:MAG TPA: TonB-dependent receptor plug domain-containing protein, partial [Saprospiraceae bacterium]|nr:TonB-dependent receptor plug domain-containing protein [Saprospiraceae bacterium]